MTTTARTIQAARTAGLILTGQAEDGQPIWLGQEDQFHLFEHLMSV